MNDASQITDQNTNNRFSKEKSRRHLFEMGGKRNHLGRAEATKNSARNVIRCREFRPCKRTSCDSCQERRRAYFVEAGTMLAKKKGLNLHVTVSWPLRTGESAWESLVRLSSMLSKRITGRAGPFIRTLALGGGDTPHAHYLINDGFRDRFYKLAKSNSPQGSRVFIDSELVKDVSGLLDYFFTKNFTPTVNDPRRVKGIRLISGSRGNITYSYPKTAHWKQLQKLRLQSGSGCEK